MNKIWDFNGTILYKWGSFQLFHYLRVFSTCSGASISFHFPSPSGHPGHGGSAKNSKICPSSLGCYFENSYRTSKSCCDKICLFSGTFEMALNQLNHIESKKDHVWPCSSRAHVHSLIMRLRSFADWRFKDCRRAMSISCGNWYTETNRQRHVTSQQKQNRTRFYFSTENHHWII